mmetsp:Transcript_22022/g.34529  ORF Transcript_22022/g.34529 Transcript_22022/m.34529 type:complete len:115 (+) Transcript_22022:1911-2255(+)
MFESACSFCKRIVYPGHGTLLVSNNHRKINFCSSKCRKLTILCKNPMVFRWTLKKDKLNEISPFSKKLFWESSYHSSFNRALLFHTVYSQKRASKLKEKRLSQINIMRKIENKF